MICDIILHSVINIASDFCNLHIVMFPQKVNGIELYGKFIRPSFADGPDSYLDKSKALIIFFFNMLLR